jgi:hypothetical protein
MLVAMFVALPAALPAVLPAVLELGGEGWRHGLGWSYSDFSRITAICLQGPDYGRTQSGESKTSALF